MIKKNVAYHEAGHAVAALLIGEFIHSIKVAPSSAPDRVTDRKGRELQACGLAETSMSFNPGIAQMIQGAYPEMHLLMVARACNAVFVAGAGVAAEAKGLKISSFPSYLAARYGEGSAATDYSNSISVWRSFGYREGEAEEMISEIWECSEKLIRRGAAWRAVTAIARAVLDGYGDCEEVDLTDIGRAVLPDAPPRPLRTPIFLPTTIHQDYPNFDAELATSLALIDDEMAAMQGRVLAPKCLVPDFDGAIFSAEWKEALWSRYSTEAPARLRQSVERYSIVKRA